MKQKVSEKFEEICSRLEKLGHTCPDPEDFRHMCMESGADPRGMDNLFYETFGISGDEMMSRYRSLARY